jgi:hypothetical protein
LVAIGVAAVIVLIPTSRSVPLPVLPDQKGVEIPYKLQAQSSVVNLVFGLSPFANPSFVHVNNIYYSIAFQGDSVLGVAISRIPFASSPLSFQTIVLTKNSALLNGSTLSYVVRNDGNANVTSCVIYVSNSWSFGVPNLQPGQTYIGSSTGWIGSSETQASTLTVVVHGWLNDQAQFQTALNVKIRG